jgi:galactofuranose transport system substrate-binding protein
MKFCGRLSDAHRASSFLLASAAGAAGLPINPVWAATPPLKVKSTYKVGFSQTESNNPRRLAETASIQDEAKKLGYQLIYADAARQAADVNSIIAYSVDAIFLPRREDKPLVPSSRLRRKPAFRCS